MDGLTSMQDFWQKDRYFEVPPRKKSRGRILQLMELSALMEK